MLFAFTLCLAPCSVSAQVLVPLAEPAISSSVVDNLVLPDAPTASPDAVQAAASGSTSEGAPTQQTKRILGIVPNFRSVSADVHLPPQTVRDKFTTAFEDSFDYSSAIFVAAQAALYYGFNDTPEFHDGWPGYARYYWHTFADTADENIWVEGILPSVLHQDNRFYDKASRILFHTSGDYAER